MSKGTLGQVVKRAISDAAFRRQLQSDPEGALKGFDLTGAERAALRSGDASKLSSLGVDQRMSKAFMLGEGASAVSKWGTGNDLAMGANTPEAGPTVDAALVTGGGRASDALIGDASGAKGARISDAGGARTGITSDSAGARTALDDQHSGARAAIGDNAAGGRAALENSGTASREGTAYITADEMGNSAVAGGSAAPDANTARLAQVNADYAASDNLASQAIHDANSDRIAQASQATPDAAGREGTAFMTADEMGSDVVAGGSASYPDSADAQREALATDAAMSNPEGHVKPDLEA